MVQISFTELYQTDFFVSETVVKAQDWHHQNNFYSCIGKPKPSHTLLWFKNCGATITDKSGKNLVVQKNQMTYMAKFSEYTVTFFDTVDDAPDTFVMHFQLQNAAGEDIIPTMEPMICFRDVDISMATAIEATTQECKKSVVCVPQVNAEIYRILAAICKKAHKRVIKNRYAFIRKGIDLLESDSDMTMTQIAALCGVSEGYFRRLFREYCGENPMEFRMRTRIEKAKQMLLLDTLTVAQIAAELHFSDIYHFSKTFKKVVGVAPTDYARGHIN